jgi:hypothetical protein
MPLENLALEVGLGVGMGTLISIVAFLSTTDKWNNRLFAYTLVIATFSAFAVIEGVEGGVDESNIIKVALLIAGVSFFTNKGLKMGQRIQNSSKSRGK